MAVVIHNKGSKINSNINVTPMVDVMLVLLIIFMVITPMLNRDIPVDLAKTNNPVEMPDAGRSDTLTVALAHDGRIFLGYEMVTQEVLTQRVKDQLNNSSKQTVYVRADSRAKYKFLVGVVNDIRSAGADRVGLLTEQTPRRTIAQ